MNIEEIPIELSVEVCPILGYDNIRVEPEFKKLCVELEKIGPTEISTRYEINPIMKKFKEETECIFIVEVKNFYPGILTSSCKMGGKVLHLIPPAFEEFFNEPFEEQKAYKYVSTDTIDAIIAKYT